jgi:hypothetical protein
MLAVMATRPLSCQHGAEKPMATQPLADEELPEERRKAILHALVEAQDVQ